MKKETNAQLNIDLTKLFNKDFSIEIERRIKECEECINEFKKELEIEESERMKTICRREIVKYEQFKEEYRKLLEIASTTKGNYVIASLIRDVVL